MSAIAISNCKFDVVEYIKKLRNVGVSQEVAEVQGQELEHVIVDVLQQTKLEAKEMFENKELVTKGDILIVKNDISLMKSDISMLKDDVSLMKSDISMLKSDVSVVKNDISLVHGEIRESELRLQKEIKIEANKLLIIYGGGFLVLLGILAKGFHWL